MNDRNYILSLIESISANIAAMHEHASEDEWTVVAELETITRPLIEKLFAIEELKVKVDTELLGGITKIQEEYKRLVEVSEVSYPEMQKSLQKLQKGKQVLDYYK